MDNTGHMIQMGVSLSIVYRIACQILPTLLPLIDSGGNWFGIVVLRLLDLFVMLEFRELDLFVMLEFREPDSFVMLEFREPDSFVMLEFSIVSLEGIFIVVLPVWLELEDVEMMDAPTKSLVTEEIVLHVPPEGNSPNTI